MKNNVFRINLHDEDAGCNYSFNYELMLLFDAVIWRIDAPNYSQNRSEYM